MYMYTTNPICYVLSFTLYVNVLSWDLYVFLMLDLLCFHVTFDIKANLHIMYVCMHARMHAWMYVM